MESNTTFNRFFNMIIALLIVMLFSSCKNNLGTEIPTDIKPTSYMKIKANPSEFVGKKLILKGTVGPSCCPSMCEMALKTGSEQVSIYPVDFKFKKVKTGTPVKLYVQVVPGEERTLINAYGVEYL